MTDTDTSRLRADDDAEKLAREIVRGPWLDADEREADDPPLLVDRIADAIRSRDVAIREAREEAQRERNRCFEWAIGRVPRSVAARAIRDGDAPNADSRDPSKCWHCGEPLHQGHFCEWMQAQLAARPQPATPSPVPPLSEFKYDFTNPVWALLYLHDWDPDGKVYPEIHGVYKDEAAALADQRAMGAYNDKYHVRKAYFISASASSPGATDGGLEASTTLLLKRLLPLRVLIDDTGGEFSGWPSIDGSPESDICVVHRAGFKQEYWGDLSQRDAVAMAELIVRLVNSYASPPVAADSGTTAARGRSHRHDERRGRGGYRSEVADLIERSRGGAKASAEDVAMTRKIWIEAGLIHNPGSYGPHQRGQELVAAALSARGAEGERKERKRAAEIVRGVPFKEHYRQWPAITGIGENAGSQANDSPITKWCDALADEIERTLQPPPEE